MDINSIYFEKVDEKGVNEEMLDKLILKIEDFLIGFSNGNFKRWERTEDIAQDPEVLEKAEDPYIKLVKNNNLGLEAIKRKDYIMARSYFSSSFGCGNENPDCNLGIMYLAGIGVERNLGKAKDILEKIAVNGNSVAQIGLGIIYGYEKNEKEMKKWFTRSAISGNKEAQYNLGLMYMRGERIEKDYRKAIKWLEKASKQGCVAAEFRLAAIDKRNIEELDVKSINKNKDIGQNSRIGM